MSKQIVSVLIGIAAACIVTGCDGSSTATPDPNGAEGQAEGNPPAPEPNADVSPGGEPVNANQDKTVDELMEQANQLVHESLQAALDTVNLVLDKDPDHKDARLLKQRITILMNVEKEIEVLDQPRLETKPGNVTEDQ